MLKIIQKIVLFQAFTSFILGGCIRSREAEDTGSITLAAPSTTKDGQKLLYRLYCNAGAKSVTADQKFQIGKETESKGDMLKIEGAKGIPVGAACLTEAVTEAPKAATSATATPPVQRVFRSSVEILGSDRRLKVQLRAVKSPETGTSSEGEKNSEPKDNTATKTGTGTRTGTGTQTGTQTTTSTNTGTSSGTSSPTQGNGANVSTSTGAAGDNLNLQIIGEGVPTECPAGGKFNTDPHVFACQ